MRTAIHLPSVDETGKPVNRDAADHIIFHGRLQNDALFSVDMSGVTNSDLGCRWRIDGEAGAVIMTSREPSLPAMEALSVKVIPTSARWNHCFADLDFDCPYIPSSPDRYSAYPSMDASREALSAIGNLYQKMSHAIGRGNTVSPDFARAVQIQKMIAALEQAGT